MKSPPTDPRNPDEIRSLLKELRTAGEAAQSNFRIIAERNERFVRGDQFSDINPTTRSIEDAWRSHLPKTSQNHLRNLINTYISRILKDRPSVTAWPASADPTALASAQVAAKLIEHIEKELQIDLRLDRVGRMGAIHGTAGFKIVYNPATDQVEWNPLTIFDYWLDPAAESFESAQWVIFNSWVDKYEATEALKAAGIQDDPPTGTYTVGDSEPREGVEVLELWHRPGPRFPSGLYVKAMGEHLLDMQKYPYLFQALETPESGMEEAVLPIVTFRIDFVRGSPYGDTWLSDAIPEQRQINETEATLLHLRRKTGNVKLVVPTNAMVQEITADSQIIVSPDGLQSVGYLQPPTINALLFADRDFHFRRLYDIAGLNEQLVGVENLKAGTSAKQVAYLSELDGMKHKGTAQSLENMLVRGWKLTLQLVQRYYISERLMRIAGDGGFTTEVFRGADIQGVHVDLQPRAGLERMPAIKAQNAAADAQQGLITPEVLAERKVTGLSETAADALTRRIVATEIKQIMQGATPQYDPHLSPGVAFQEALRIAALLRDSGAPAELLVIIKQYADAYGQAAAQAQAPQELTDG